MKHKIFLQRDRVQWLSILLCGIGWLLWVSPVALANHRGGDGHAHSEASDFDESAGYEIPGASFQVHWKESKGSVEYLALGKTQREKTIQAVVDAFTMMVKDRVQYTRFDESLTKGVLQNVIIEPKVVNREGKEFMFLVARTKQKGSVRLLINASMLKEQGFITHPKQLVPLLAREFQWVISKSDTSKMRRKRPETRNLKHAPIQTKKAIGRMSGVERETYLQKMFEGYLTTVDDFNSLEGQPYYEIGSDAVLAAAQADSTTHFYDIRVREALQRIVRESEFFQNTPKAVRNLLSGKIWNVSFVHIDSRDWATRTRVLPQDKAVKVGEKETLIQPAKVLINLHRKAIPDDPYYALTNDLPMGALSISQLAQVIALEIEHQIIEKSMRGHVAADEQSAP